MTLMFLYTWHYRSNLRAAYMRTARKVAIKKRSLGWMLYGYLSQESSSKENEVAPILKLAGLNSFWKKKIPQMYVRAVILPCHTLASDVSSYLKI